MLREDLSCVEDPFALVTAITGGLSPTATAAATAAAGERANPLSGSGTAAGTAAAAATETAGESANPLSGSGTAAAGEEVRP